MESYFELLHAELEQRYHMVPDYQVKSIYFGGGTPSLAKPQQIISLLQKFSKLGFHFEKDMEITIEINPATLDTEKIEALADHGVNRYSVGAQTFSDRLLKVAGRLHSVDDTLMTLDLLKRRQLNFSLDLLFALPSQSLDELRTDLRHIVSLCPPHVSAYCLTVPSKHPMSLNRPDEDIQLRMFVEIEEQLAKIQLQRYEISNFARPGYESRHNLVYWRNDSFWGLGLSAHSYFNVKPWGLRFWNPSDIQAYADQIHSGSQSVKSGTQDSPSKILPKGQWEALQVHQALTDYCHMHLRTQKGLPWTALCINFPKAVVERLKPRLDTLEAKGWLLQTAGHYVLSEEGRILSNQVFLELTFLADDLRGLRNFNNEILSPSR